MKVNTKYETNSKCLKMNQEISIETTLSLLEQLKDISLKIEEYIRQSYKSLQTEQIEAITALDPGTTAFSMQQQIAYYKDMSYSIQAKLEGLYNLKRIENMEQEIRVKKEQLYNVKNENNVLMSIQKNHRKALSEYQQKYDNKNEVLLLTEKLKNLKEEYNYTKALVKSTENKVKNQIATINLLNEKCNIIKDNIEYKQRQNISPSKSDQQGKYPDENLPQLENSIRYLEIQISTEEKNYKNELQRQSKTIPVLYDEMSKINIQLKEKEQEIRINELKLKELKKINPTQNQVLIKNKTENEKENIRALSANFRIIIGHGANNINYQKNQIENLMSKTPISTSCNKSQKKAFQIPLTRNNGNGIYSTTGKKANSTLPAIHPERERAMHTSVEKDEILEQIEELKNEIKTAMKVNDRGRIMNITRNCKESDAIQINDNQIFRPLTLPAENKERHAIEEKRKPFEPFVIRK